VQPKVDPLLVQINKDRMLSLYFEQDQDVVSVKYSVRFVKKYPDTFVYEFVVEPKHRWDTEDFKKLINNLEDFGVMDQMETITFDKYPGYHWDIGDGDDGLAVYVRDGAICIWLRGFKD
jgi:hypothetical protein